MECVMNTEIVIGGERFEEAMPQKRPMLMLDSLDSYEYDESGPELTGVCSYCAGRRGCPALDADGSFPSWALIEVMAQAVTATMANYYESRGIRTPVGLLIGVRRYVQGDFAAVPRLTDLTLRAHSGFFDESMAAFDCSAGDGSGLISAEAKLIVCRPGRNDFVRMFSRPGRAAPDPGLFAIS